MHFTTVYQARNPLSGYDNAERVAGRQFFKIPTTAACEGLLKGILSVSVILCPLTSAFSEPAPIVTFDAPGAGAESNQGTFAENINDFGDAVGYFIDGKNVYHGFVRSRQGVIKIIEAPGAGAVAESGQGTAPESMNCEGEIAGQYQDANNVYHGFLRKADGRFVVFDAPGAGTGPGQGTAALNINLEGEIAGDVVDSHNVYHAFLRSRSGAFTVFDAPGAGTGPNQGTVTSRGTGLNLLGVTIGWSIDAKSEQHGYVRERGGAITTFDPSGSVDTNPGSINPEGVTVGGALDANGIFHGFIRSAKGVLSTFDVPGAGSTPGLPIIGSEGTLALGITPFGLIAGYWADSKTIYHGFVRYPNGKFIKFDALGAGTVPLSLQGTVPQGMNNFGEIVGVLQDSNFVYHGFVRSANDEGG